MSSDDVAYAPISALSALYRRRELSPVEVTRCLLARIEKLNPRLQAFITVTPEQALNDARLAEEAIGRGDGRPLLGIPIAHKDIFLTRGIRTTAGSALLADWIPTDESTCGRRLQEAGTVLLGKLTTNEFAFGLQYPGHRFQPARNPWNSDNIPGGSSSGSGAALAAGLVKGATGSDTGGSIRIPASFCGVVGLKPTYGRSSRAGVLTLSWTLDHTGPMARTVEDCALLLQPLAGYDPLDPTSSHAPVEDYCASLHQDLRRLRIGVIRNYFFEGIDPDVERTFEEAIATLRKLGAEVRDVRIPSLQATHSFLLILLAEAYAYHESDLREHPELYGDVLRERLQAGALITASEYMQAHRIRSMICNETAEVLQNVDVLATPTTPSPATPFAQAHDPEFGFPRMNTPPFSISGLPTLALPCGFSSAGLPISLQLSGKPFAEATVLRVGHAYEQATTWHTQRPPI